MYLEDQLKVCINYRDYSDLISVVDRIIQEKGWAAFLKYCKDSEIGIDKLDPTLDLRKSASLLAQRDILLIGGWDDDGPTIDHHILPLYRALKSEKAENVRIVAFQDDHGFGNSRAELAQTIIEWLKTASERKKNLVFG